MFDGGPVTGATSVGAKEHPTQAIAQLPCAFVVEPPDRRRVPSPRKEQVHRPPRLRRMALDFAVRFKV